MEPSRSPIRRGGPVLVVTVALLIGACAEGSSRDAAVAPTRAGPAAAAVVIDGPGATSAVDPETASAIEPPPPRAAVAALAGDHRPLPLPTSTRLPEGRAIAPSVVTAAGSHRLLRDVSVVVRYEPGGGIGVEPAGWWVINYPLQRIVGFDGESDDEISRLLFGVSPADVGNYYFYTEPGHDPPPREPPPPTGPAPIDVTRGVTLVVDNRRAQAADTNPGTLAEPLRTIAAALDRARPGTTIHVYPGVYRESVVIERGGTAGAPIRIEGIRGATGTMPVITGNDPFPPGAWDPVPGAGSVYRADLLTGLPGPVSANGVTLTESDLAGGLAPGEYAISLGSESYAFPRFDGRLSPTPGSTYSSGASTYPWRRVEVDGAGFLDLSGGVEEAPGGVMWGSTWVWVERPNDAADYQWFGESDFATLVDGPFRAARRSGVPAADQPREYRMWLDGELLTGMAAADSVIGEPHPDRGAGDFGDRWQNLVMRAGWHHLVFQWNTTAGAAAGAARFRMRLPDIVGGAVTSAVRPRGAGLPGRGEARPYVGEFMVLGPFPAELDPTVYVRLLDGADPADLEMDVSARRGPVVAVRADFVEVRGLEIRNGAQAQGEGLVAVGRRQGRSDDVFVSGVVIEGNLIHDGEFAGIDIQMEGDQGVAPIVVRNNWIVSPGAVGIVARGGSNRLAADNLDDWAPGRTRAVIEHNRVVDANWTGYSPLDGPTGGMVITATTGLLVRYNTIIGGNGPGITLETDNYGTRVEGNRIVGPWGWGVGVNGNPGPNLIADNVITGLRPGPEWLKAHLLVGDSDQTWLVNNTTDGEWNSESGWFGDVGTWGAGGPSNSSPVADSTWELSRFRRDYYNNLFLGGYLGGVESYDGGWGETDTFEANFREVPVPDLFDYNGEGAAPAGVRRAFRDRPGGDYRIVGGNALNDRGVDNWITNFVRHDFSGLLRFADDGTSVGAFRPPLDVEPGTSVVEVEYGDGTMRRFLPLS